MEFEKFKENIHMLKINLICDDCTSHAGDSTLSGFSLDERGTTIKNYIDSIIIKNTRYTEMIFLDCTQALVLNAAIHDIEFLLKLLNATYRKRRLLVRDEYKQAVLKQEQLNSVSRKKDQLARFKASVPMHEMFRNLGIHDIPINEMDVAANQARIDILHQDMNNLCAVFAFCHIHPARCQSVCNYYGIKNVYNMRWFDMSKFRFYAKEHDTPDH